MARRPLLFLLFALSGVAGLIYETLWLRTLVLTFGSTVLALGTILSAFMAGLAVGSLVIGRATVATRRPLRLYGLLEIGIGLSALVLPAVFSAARALTGALFPGWQEGSALFPIVRFALSFVILLFPTFLMGGTLPAMTRHLVRAGRDLGRTGGFLYFANTAGAVLGSILGAFVLIPAIGMTRTNLVAVGINLGVGLLVLAAARGEERAAVEEGTGAAAEAGDAGGGISGGAGPVERGALRPATLFALYGVAGFAALAIEVIWTRALLLTLGTTVYAFSTMLSTYLVGLALGGFVGARLSTWTRTPGRMLGFLYAAAGVAVLVGNRLLGTLPLRYLRLQLGLGLSWNSSIVIKFFLAALVMLPTTFLLGAVFPIALRALGGGSRGSGRTVGSLYAANTAGSILGSLLAGLVLVRLLGLERGLVLMGAIFLLVGVAFLAASRSRALLPVGALAAIAVVASLLLPGWDRYLQRSGVYFYAPRYSRIDEFLKARQDYTILSYDEGPEATVAVVDGQKNRYLQINGKTDASTGKDMITQILCAHLPMLFHENPKKVLVIGLGSGVTVGSVEKYPVETIRCLEIAPEVVTAAGLFAEASGDALNDPRLTVTIGDGRNYLARTRESFDVIISEPTNPWIAGVGSLFTSEFLRLARSRLSPGGVMCQWTNLYDLSGKELAIMLATYRKAFPDGAVFLSNLGDILLIGMDRPPRLDFARVLANVERPEVQADLARAGISTVYDLFGNYLFSFDALDSLVPAGTPIHTDDRAQLEFSAPKNVYKDFTTENLARILPLHKPIVPLVAGLPEGELGEQVRRAFEASAAAKNFSLQGTLVASRGEMAAAAANLRQAHRLAPNEMNFSATLAEYAAAEGERLIASGDGPGAVARFREATALVEDDARYPYYLGRALALTDPQAGLADLTRATHLDPKLSEARYALAAALASLGREKEGRFQLDQLAALRPGDPVVYLRRGNIAAKEGDFSAAMQDYLRALDLDPGLSEARVNLAFAYARTGREDLALREYRRLSKENPDDVPTLFNLANLTTRLGEMKQAEKLWVDLVRRDPNNEEFRRNLEFVRAGGKPKG